MKTVLKVFTKLIPDEIEKKWKKILENLEKYYDFLHDFPEFYGSRSLQIRALFFYTIKIGFYMNF